MNWAASASSGLFRSMAVFDALAHEVRKQTLVGIVDFQKHDA